MIIGDNSEATWSSVIPEDKLRAKESYAKSRLAIELQRQAWANPVKPSLNMPIILTGPRKPRRAPDEPETPFKSSWDNTNILPAETPEQLKWTFAGTPEDPSSWNNPNATPKMGSTVPMKQLWSNTNAAPPMGPQIPEKLPWDTGNAVPQVAPWAPMKSLSADTNARSPMRPRAPENLPIWEKMLFHQWDKKNH